MVKRPAPKFFSPPLLAWILALSLILLIGLAACGSSESATEGPDATVAPGAATGRAATAPATSSTDRATDTPAPSASGTAGSGSRQSTPQPGTTPVPGQTAAGRATPAPPTGGATPAAASQRAGQATPPPTATPSPTPPPTSPKTDREALIAVYNAFDLLVPNEPLSQWDNVRTDIDGRVVELDFSEFGLTGEIPPELGNLTNLTSLSLGDNGLTGEIPPELGNLINLTFLGLWRNELTGEIPPELGNLTNLTFLYLGDNGLTGEIPPELGNLTNLTSLSLGDNGLTGEIPPELGNLINLTSLRLGDNGLTGEIPPELGNLINLTSLRLGDNGLTGEIPPELGNLINLTSLRLGDNELSGCVSDYLRELGAPLKRCPIADHPGDTETLIDLYHAWGKPGLQDWLSPLSIGDWEGVSLDQEGRVVRLALGYDGELSQLSGEIPPELGNLTNLTFLGLGDNELTGEIPPELGNLTNLTFLDLVYNELTGEIPPELGNLTNLTFLDLGDNELTGEIPPELGNLTQLERLRLPWNQLRLSGECFPDAWPSFEYLSSDSDIPSGWGNLPTCSEKAAKERVLNSIPVARAALTALYNATDGDNWRENTNWLSDAPLGEWSGVTTGRYGVVTRLRLQHNKLSGEIPPELGDLTRLMTLYLYGNRLSGCVPSGLEGELTDAELGDLTYCP